jgi:hypothetical protein
MSNPFTISLLTPKAETLTTKNKKIYFEYDKAFDFIEPAGI